MPVVIGGLATWLTGLGVGTAAAGATASVLATTIATVVVDVAISLAVSAITQALAGKKSGAGDPPNREVTARGTVQFQQLIYGEVKTGGYLAFLGTSGANNGILWAVIVLAGHEIDSFSDLWLDSRHIPHADIDPTTGAVSTAAFQGGGASRLSIGHSNGGSSGFFDTTLAAACPEWDSSHLGKGVPYIVFSMGHDDVAWPSGAPSSFFALVRGRKLYDPRLDSTNGGSGSQRYTDPSTWTWSQNWALAVRDYLSGGAVVYSGTPDKRKGFGEADARIDDAYIIAAANHADESVAVPLPIIAGTTNWTNASNAIIGNGTQFTNLTVGNYLLGPNGTAYAIATITDDTHLTITVGGGYPGTTVINEIVHWSPTNATSTTELRFTADCQLSCGSTHLENVQVLLSGANGHLTYAGGKWRVFAGVYTAPTVTLTQDDFLGPIDVLTHDPTDQVWNYVTGTFFDENNGWAQMPFPAQQNPGYETDDGRQYQKSIDQQATRGVYRAQRNGQVILQLGRNMLTVSASDLSQRAMQIIEWDTIYVTIPEYGWTNQVLRVVSWKFLASGHVAIQARSESSSAYADMPVSGYVDPSTNNPPAFVTGPPDPPQSFTALGAMNGVTLAIVPPVYFPSSSFIEIWEYTSNSPFSSATRVGTTRGSTFTVPHSDTVTRYYWVTTGDNNGGRSTNVPGGAGQAAAPLASQFWSPQLRGTAASVGGTIFKNGGSGAWDSDATSAIPYPSVSVEGTYTGVGASGIGLASAVGSALQPNSTAGYYGIYPHADAGQTVVFAGSTVLAVLAAPTGGDRYRISGDGFYVLFYVNNVIEAAAPQPAPMYVGIAMYHPGETFINVQVSTSNIATPSQWKETGNCIVSDASAMKQGGSSGWLSDGICSLQGHATCHIAAKANSDLNNNLIFGLTSRPSVFLAATSNQQNQIDAAWNASTPSAGGNQWVISESGTSIATFSAPSATDVPWITYDGTNFRYYLNDPTTPVHTTNDPGITALYGAATFYDPGGGLNSIDFGPGTTRGVADSAQIGANAATNVVTSTLASWSIGPGTTTALSTTLPAPPQDSLVIVTALYNAYWASGLSMFALLECTNVQSGPTSGGLVDIAHAPGAVSPGPQFAVQWEFPVAAGVAATVLFVTEGATGASGGVANLVIQHEIVKK